MSTQAESWEVVENAYLYNQHTVATRPSFDDARLYVQVNYKTEEIDELNIDITRNGSTEH
ncbi:hypothetical protein [Marinimicrobium sp. ABcell2]|uniref:hypothetical protein n=1 Tax=Marinimicrobium sp. ABcell2 TaxID=3069751 RepID=UPI0027B52086|nr:hypothetical protein [Marinimicrobium sp. ABcell2]MDQ2077455.1 hypothetical protein [Marinimicrobium sp. ABcell2]